MASSARLLRRLELYFPSQQTFQSNYHIAPTWEGLGILIWNLIVMDMLVCPCDPEVELMKSELLIGIENLISGPSLQLPWKEVLPNLKSVVEGMLIRYVQWVATQNVTDAEQLSSNEKVVADVLQLMKTELKRDHTSTWNLFEALTMPLASEIVDTWYRRSCDELVTAFKIRTYVLTHSGPTAGKYGEIFGPVMIHTLHVQHSYYPRGENCKEAGELKSERVFLAVLESVRAMAQFGYEHPEKQWEPPEGQEWVDWDCKEGSFFSNLFKAVYSIKVDSRPELLFELSLLVKYHSDYVDFSSWRWLTSQLTWTKLPASDNLIFMHQLCLDLVENNYTARPVYRIRSFLPDVLLVGTRLIYLNPSNHRAVIRQLERIIRRCGFDPDSFKMYFPFATPCERCRAEGSEIKSYLGFSKRCQEDPSLCLSFDYYHLIAAEITHGIKTYGRSD